jgi:hypothetical protein
MLQSPPPFNIDAVLAVWHSQYFHHVQRRKALPEFHYRLAIAGDVDLQLAILINPANDLGV